MFVLKMKYHIVILLTYLVVVMVTITCLDTSLDARWQQFKKRHVKSYNSDDEGYRRSIWELKIREIEEHNREADKGGHSYWLKETQWDDLTYGEFMYNRTDLDTSLFHKFYNKKNETCLPPADIPDDLPDSIDWTPLGYVTSVKDQGRCGSCWAQSAVGAVEGQWYKKTKKLISLSSQSLVDCDKNNSGCNGGTTLKAYDFITKNGLPSEEDYPYKEADESCKLSSKIITARIKGYNETNTDEELLKSLALVGPISVAITTGPKIQNYGRGVFDGCLGPRNHAVVVVGYGTYNGKKVWKVKNSYGDTWGTDGYFYITRECRNACALADMATYPIIDDIPSQACTSRMSFFSICLSASVILSRRKY